MYASALGTVQDPDIAVVTAGTLMVPPGPALTYTFMLESDDGTLLYIDGALLDDDHGALCLRLSIVHIRQNGKTTRTSTTRTVRRSYNAASGDAFALSGARGLVLNISDTSAGVHGFNGFVSGKVTLAAGAHSFRLDYFQDTGGAGILVEVSTTGSTAPPQPIKASTLSHATVISCATVADHLAYHMRAGGSLPPDLVLPPKLWSRHRHGRHAGKGWGRCQAEVQCQGRGRRQPSGTGG